MADYFVAPDAYIAIRADSQTSQSANFSCQTPGRFSCQVKQLLNVVLIILTLWQLEIDVNAGDWMFGDGFPEMGHHSDIGKHTKGQSALLLH